MDNFKGQVTDAVTSLLESNNIHVYLLPSNTTDRLQPMDLTVNKPAKAFLKGRFEEWYSQQLMKQLKGKDMESVELQPVSLDLHVSILKELIAKWMVEMADNFAQNPLVIVKGFIKAGITGTLDRQSEEQSDDEEEENVIDEEIDEEEEIVIDEESDEEEEIVIDEESGDGEESDT